jgi:hypothetical protein
MQFGPLLRIFPSIERRPNAVKLRRGYSRFNGRDAIVPTLRWRDRLAVFEDLHRSDANHVSKSYLQRMSVSVVVLPGVEPARSGPDRVRGLAAQA